MKKKELAITLIVAVALFLIIGGGLHNWGNGAAFGVGYIVGVLLVSIFKNR